MTSNLIKTTQRVVLAALLAATLAACSSPGEQTASLDGTSHVRSWADWSAAPVLQTAALPQANSWVDTAQIAPGGMVPGNLVSNSGAGN